MSKVLILSANYLGAANANGICAKNIAKQLTKNGHEVSVLCYDNGKDSEERVYTIPSPVRKTRKSFFEKAFAILKGFFSPELSRDSVSNYEDIALKICQENNIDTVVAMFFPFETVAALKIIKKRTVNIKTIVYELDSVGDGIFGGFKHQKHSNGVLNCLHNFRYRLADRAIKRWCDRQYSYADRVILMRTHEEYWKNTFGKKHGNKLSIADIPVLVERPLPKVEKSAEAPLRFLYGGLIQEAYRSPNYLLKIFEEYRRHNEAELHFFSKGDCEDKIADAAKRIGGIFQHGYVPEAELDIAIAEADVLLSIGNSVSKSVPSKLITYLAYGKPVIHFSSQKDDVCMSYLEKYPLGLVIKEWDSVKENVSKLQRFMEETKGKTVSFESVSSVLMKNTPEYSARLLF